MAFLLKPAQMMARSFFYTFYSIGGGFIVCDELNLSEQYAYRFPFPIDSAEDLNKWAHSTNKSITQVVTENELSLRTEKELKIELNRIWEVMADCMFKGCHSAGHVAGGP